MENDSTREWRQTSSSAVEEYRERLNKDPENEREITRDVAEKFDVSQKDLRERAAAGA